MVNNGWHGKGWSIAPSHPPLVFCRSSLSWRLPHSQQFLKGGVMSCQGWHRWSKWTNDKQWLGRHAKIVPTKTCQCKLSGQVLPCCGSLPKFCSWSMSMASVELHSYMIIVFFVVRMNHNSCKGSKAALDTQRFERIWELEGKHIKSAKTQQDWEPTILNKGYKMRNSMCRQTNSQSWSWVVFSRKRLILRW